MVFHVIARSILLAMAFGFGIAFLMIPAIQPRGSVSGVVVGGAFAIFFGCFLLTLATEALSEDIYRLLVFKSQSANSSLEK